MAKKKKNKNRKIENKKYQTMTPEALIELGNDEIKSGNVRDAISHYKQALKNKGNPSDINILLFKAYLHREKQLSDKGMFREAEAIRLNIIEYKPETEALSQEELHLCLNAFPLGEAITLYNEAFAANGPSPSAEKMIADKLLLSENMALLNNLHEESALKAHCRDVQSAVSAMNGGEWDKALQHLKNIPRVSPWSQTKLFCKAMVSFLADDDKSLPRSLSQLPVTSPFASTVRTLRLYAESSNWNFLSENQIAANLLFEGDTDLFPQIDTLVRQVETDSASMAKPVILSIAAGLYPKNPKEAARSLIEVIWQHCRMPSVSPHRYGGLTNKMFPQKEASLIFLKAMLNYGPKVFLSAFELYQRVGELFSDTREITMAKSELFTYLATRLLDDTELMYEDDDDLDGIAQIMGSEACLARYDHNEFCFSLIEHAVSIDPSNRAAYELAESCSLHGIKNKRLETFYQPMLDQFPDEPYPCLKLADIYDRMNAYRKSENILKEALKRAPHDNRVLERYALSFLISAEKNMRSGKIHLVEADISKAEAFNLPVHMEVIAEKKLLFQCLQSNNTKPESLLADSPICFTNVQRFRIMSLLIYDMKSKKLESESLTAYFKKDLGSNLKHLSSMERATLLMPVDKVHVPVFSHFYVAELFLQHDKKYLERIHDDDFINLLATAVVIGKKNLAHFKKSIGTRIKKAAGANQTILKFGYAAIKYIEGDDEMEQTLAEITSDAPSDILVRLKAVSTVLASLTGGSRRENLVRCDFRNFDLMKGMPDLFDFGLPDEDMYETEKMEFDEIQNMLFFVLSLASINKSSPRTAVMKVIGDANRLAQMLEFDKVPFQMVLRARNELMKSLPPLGETMNKFASRLDDNLAAQLSKGAYAFVTGKKKP